MNNNNPEQEKQHKRRVRYSGTHPRSYKEKYKEHNPEKYADTIEKVIQKGSTPAGMHISICVKEIIDFLQIQPGQVGLDATLGYGGHTKAMLECLKGEGHIYALDVDPIESAKTKERLAKQCIRLRSGRIFRQGGGILRQTLRPRRKGHLRAEGAFLFSQGLMNAGIIRHLRADKGCSLHAPAIRIRQQDVQRLCREHARTGSAQQRIGNSCACTAHKKHIPLHGCILRFRKKRGSPFA